MPSWHAPDEQANHRKSQRSYDEASNVAGLALMLMIPALVLCKADADVDHPSLYCLPILPGLQKRSHPAVVKAGLLSKGEGRAGWSR